MDTPDEDIQRKIEALKRSFIGTLEQRLGEVEAAFARLSADAPLAEQKDTIKTLLEHAHKIAGSAGTFGYGAMSVIAAETEQLCDRVLTSQHGGDASARSELAAKVAALRAAAGR